MAQTQATTTTNPSTNGNASTNKREVKPPTAIEAITKISKILDQLSPTDRRRVLTFINDNESNA